ncbi:hypothetical protein ENU1_140500 [Entamoeba nuttalli P19]|uniref:UDENN domain-containing protein n=1 Tax=Entamoeba nuttalli (strain P19) TaxID=1076696 RepID=K2H9B3_ENTNP|nr:hypothetical protein ENU1_140500 [Entamoeba nuttalli P19]EKE39144.1 hypothetical protein ENU1_140500 [Entamoeba nuttalli P19]|eukprot:XP_008858525.1 hypothetical protein ENU1_140500 [Entamoeba nuttalli P19]
MSAPLSDICSSPLERAITLTSSNLVSSFSIWGLPSNFKTDEFSFWRKSYTYDAQKLFCYPPQADLQEHFSKFIAPQGVTATQTNKLNVLLEAPKKYLLILPGETSTSFCVCIVRKELLQFPSDFIEETVIQKIYTIGANPIVVDRIYCFVSECPHINALFSMLEDMEILDFHSKNNYIKAFYLRNGGNPSEKYVSNKSRMIDYLNKVLAVEAPDLKEYSFSITIPPAPTRTFYRSCLYDSLAPGDKQAACCLQMIADYALPRLFVGVQIPVILSALSSLLSGNSVILVGNNASLITSSVFGLLALLYPFIWQGVLIPFVPVQLQEFLESPVPSLYGTEIPKDITRVIADVIQLEQGSVFDPTLEKRIIKTNPVIRHALPFAAELSSALGSCVQATFADIIKFKTFNERERALENIPQQKLVSFSSDVQQKIKHHLYDKLLSFVRNYCISKGPIDLPQFQQGFPQIIKHESHKQFIKEFIGSQHFNVWWYRNKMNELCKVSVTGSPSPISLGGSKASSTSILSPCRTPDVKTIEDFNGDLKIESYAKELPAIPQSSLRKSYNEKVIIKSESKESKQQPIQIHLNQQKNEEINKPTIETDDKEEKQIPPEIIKDEKSNENLINEVKENQVTIEPTNQENKNEFVDPLI